MKDMRLAIRRLVQDLLDSTAALRFQVRIARAAPERQRRCTDEDTGDHQSLVRPRHGERVKMLRLHHADGASFGTMPT
jgi:hypothetical protein